MLWLNYEIDSKEMVWALHGAVGLAADWQPLARICSEQGLTLRAVDLWRFLDCCPMSLEEFGRAFCEEVRAVDDNPILLGYSMGGRLALHALLHEPTMWAKAMIVSAHTGLSPQAEDERFKRMVDDAEWAAAALTGEWRDFLNRWNAQSVLVGSDMPERSQLEIRRQAVARSFMDWTLSKQDDLSEQLSRISCPVTWVVGERDEKFLRIAEAAMRQIPQGELETVKNCGHRVPWEQPDMFAKALIRFCH